MSTAAARPDPFPVDGWKRAGWVLLAAYVVYAAAQMDVSWDRVVSGLHNARHFFERLFPPNFSRWDLLVKGLGESLQIAVLASALGIALSLPIGLAASRNLVPAWMSWPARLLIVAARSFHPVIVAILFVKAVGFGALAGILALALASIGFTAKLFAEAIEEISLKQVEAVRATGSMGLAMAIHLGFILAFFLMLPYSKMVHGVYRAAALLRRGVGGGLPGLPLRDVRRRFAAYQALGLDEIVVSGARNGTQLLNIMRAVQSGYIRSGIDKD